MRFILGLSTVLLLVIALALPAAVLAQESAAPTEAEVSVGETSVETAPPETSDPGAPAEISDPEVPETNDPEAPPETNDPEAPAEPGTEPGEESPETNITIEDLISAVEELNLQQGIENSLDAKLQNARDSLTAANAGLREDAINKLQAFVNACEAQRDKALTNEQADELIGMANTIIASL